MYIICSLTFFTFSFPVDFSTANIFNSAQYNNTINNNINNNIMVQPISTTSTPAFSAFNSSTASSKKLIIVLVAVKHKSNILTISNFT